MKSNDPGETEKEKKEREGVKKPFLCPIISYSFFLNEKIRISEIEHLKVSYPHIAY